MLPDRLRVFNKYVTNRVLRGLATGGIGPFAVIGHVGRRSGKRYEATIMVWPTGDGFIIALTYGPNVDWRRNMVATGGGSIFWHGRLYTVGAPQPVDAATALKALPAFFRFVLRRVSPHEQFVWLKTLSVSSRRLEK